MKTVRVPTPYGHVGKWDNPSQPRDWMPDIILHIQEMLAATYHNWMREMRGITNFQIGKRFERTPNPARPSNLHRSTLIAKQRYKQWAPEGKFSKSKTYKHTCSNIFGVRVTSPHRNQTSARGHSRESWEHRPEVPAAFTLMQKRPERRAQRAKEKLGLLTKKQATQEQPGQKQTAWPQGKFLWDSRWRTEERRTDKKTRNVRKSQTDLLKV